MVALLQHIFSCWNLRRGFLILLTSLQLMLHAGEWSCAQEVSEYHIKAVFLYNLTHFVNWPPDSVKDDEEFVIAIYGPDPFGSIIDKAVSGEQKYDKPIAVKRYLQLSQLDPTTCNILFIHSSKIGDWHFILQQFEGQPVLTVSDTTGFPENGGMVNLLKTGLKIQVEINHGVVRKSGLSMSAQLLSLARLVD